MSKISMNNGTTAVDVTELSDEQIALAMEFVRAGDDNLREAIHAQGHDDERSFLTAYCEEHTTRLGECFKLP